MRGPEAEGRLQPPTNKHLSSQSYNHKEMKPANNHVSGKANPFLVEPLDEDPILPNTSRNPAKPWLGFKSTEIGTVLSH